MRCCIDSKQYNKMAVVVSLYREIKITNERFDLFRYFGCFNSINKNVLSENVLVHMSARSHSNIFLNPLTLQKSYLKFQKQRTTFLVRKTYINMGLINGFINKLINLSINLQVNTPIYCHNPTDNQKQLKTTFVGVVL